MYVAVYRDQVKLTGKKRGHDGTEKTTVKVQGVIHYPELNKVLILPNTKQNAASIKKSRRRNELFFIMLGKYPYLEIIFIDYNYTYFLSLFITYKFIDIYFLLFI